MKISIFYFSGTGNTWWVCQEFMKMAIERNHDVKLYNIELMEKLEAYQIISEVDVLGFAYPIYGSDIPKNMKSFIQKIVNELNENPPSNTPSIIILTSMMIFSGDGALIPRNYFRNTPLSLKWAKNFALSSNISVPGFRMNPADEKRLQKRKNRAKDELASLILNIENNIEDKKPQMRLVGRFLGWLQRVFLEITVKHLLIFSIDSDLCIKCMKCVNQCPSQNIVFNEYSKIFSYLDKCVWCMRCYNFCPTQAVLIKGRYCNPKKFIRFQPISKDFKIY